MSSAFVVIVLGLSLAFLFFLLELIYHRFIIKRIDKEIHPLPSAEIDGYTLFWLHYNKLYIYYIFENRFITDEDLTNRKETGPVDTLNDKLESSTVTDAENEMANVIIVVDIHQHSEEEVIEQKD